MLIFFKLKVWHYNCIIKKDPENAIFQPTLIKFRLGKDITKK
jgi:hypothetical protein